MKMNDYNSVTEIYENCVENINFLLIEIILYYTIKKLCMCKLFKRATVILCFCDSRLKWPISILRLSAIMNNCVDFSKGRAMIVILSVPNLSFELVLLYALNNLKSYNMNARARISVLSESVRSLYRNMN